MEAGGCSWPSEADGVTGLVSYFLWLSCCTHLNSPEGPTYTLKEFPKGYRLFEERTGPPGKLRRNMYLYGTVPHSPQAFRSDLTARF